MWDSSNRRKFPTKPKEEEFRINLKDFLRPELSSSLCFLDLSKGVTEDEAEEVLRQFNNTDEELLKHIFCVESCYSSVAQWKLHKFILSPSFFHVSKLTLLEMRAADERVFQLIGRAIEMCTTNFSLRDTCRQCL